MKSSRIVKVCEIVFLIVLTVCRVFTKESNTRWISLICILGVIIALMDLLYTIYTIVQQSTAFFLKSVMVGIISALIGNVILLALVFTDTISLNEKWNDVFTLMTLLVSLPQKLYLDIIKKIIE